MLNFGASKPRVKGGPGPPGPPSGSAPANKKLHRNYSAINKFNYFFVHIMCLTMVFFSIAFLLFIEEQDFTKHDVCNHNNSLSIVDHIKYEQVNQSN